MKPSSGNRSGQGSFDISSDLKLVSGVEPSIRINLSEGEGQCEEWLTGSPDT
ncbi:hypothetical protein scyTo_0021786, partial [Scyliorhinus torazame]|nr:hypothetical protein [Scyliorhinus torazame]